MWELIKTFPATLAGSLIGVAAGVGAGVFFGGPALTATLLAAGLGLAGMAAGAIGGQWIDTAKPPAPAASPAVAAPPKPIEAPGGEKRYDVALNAETYPKLVDGMLSVVPDAALFSPRAAVKTYIDANYGEFKKDIALHLRGAMKDGNVLMVDELEIDKPPVDRLLQKAEAIQSYAKLFVNMQPPKGSTLPKEYFTIGYWLPDKDKYKCAVPQTAVKLKDNKPDLSDPDTLISLDTLARLYARQAYPKEKFNEACVDNMADLDLNAMTLGGDYMKDLAAKTGVEGVSKVLAHRLDFLLQHDSKHRYDNKPDRDALVQSVTQRFRETFNDRHFRAKAGKLSGYELAQAIDSRMFYFDHALKDGEKLWQKLDDVKGDMPISNSTDSRSIRDYMFDVLCKVYQPVTKGLEEYEKAHPPVSLVPTPLQEPLSAADIPAPLRTPVISPRPAALNV